MSFWVTLRKDNSHIVAHKIPNNQSKVCFGLQNFTNLEQRHVLTTHNNDGEDNFRSRFVDGAVWQSVTLLTFSNVWLTPWFWCRDKLSIKSHDLDHVCVYLYKTHVLTSSCQIGAPDYGGDPPTTIDQIKQKIKNLNLERDSGAPDVRFPCSCLDPTTCVDKSQASLLRFTPILLTFLLLHPSFPELVTLGYFWVDLERGGFVPKQELMLTRGVLFAMPMQYAQQRWNHVNL